jgi:hypothetical protein
LNSNCLMDWDGVNSIVKNGSFTFFSTWVTRPTGYPAGNFIG